MPDVSTDTAQPTIKRLLGPAPTGWDGTAPAGTPPEALDVNQVDVDGTEHGAVYLPVDHPLDEAGWAALLAAWTPPPPAAAARRRSTLAALGTKARAVYRGEETFTAAQLQRVVAALTLHALGDEDTG